jgi:predicted RNA-binding protein with RPS1 domain
LRQSEERVGDAPEVVATALQAEALAHRILDPQRTRHLVGVTTEPWSGKPLVDVPELADRIDGRADVVVIETGEATWALTDALPERLDVYRGALRLWKRGVTAQSDPRDHPLLLLTSSADVPQALWRLRRELEPERRPQAPLGMRVRDTVTATVTSVTEADATVDIGGVAGRIAKSGMAAAKVRDARDVLQVGQLVQGRILRYEDEVPVLTIKPGQPKPAERFRMTYSPGDVLRGRVTAVQPYGVFVEVLPGVRGLAHASELPEAPTAHQPGEVLTVKVLDYGEESDLSRLALSVVAVKPDDAVRPSIALLPGGPVFLQDEAVPSSAALAEAARLRDRLQQLEAENDQLAAELHALQADRRAVVDQFHETRAELHRLRKAVRGERNRRRQVESRYGLVVEVSDEEEFVEAVHAAYARMYAPGDREQYPLCDIQLGDQFLDRLDSLEGVPVEKVVEVCAHVAAGRHVEIAGLDVHQLRHGPAGAPARTRSSDGAHAWRCALQIGTPSARRFHWWELPGAPRRVEFASVGVHDDMEIPE